MATPNVWTRTKQISTNNLKNPQNIPAGRSPWYHTSTRSSKRRCKQTFLIGVAGGTASGKTSVCRAVVNNLQLPWVQILSLDCFYRPLTKEERDNVADYNFDHPNAFDWDLLLSVLLELKQGKAVKCPQYDFTTHSRKEEYTVMYGADVVLCEGILMLHDPDVVKQFDVKVFVTTDDDIRLIRRIKRDIKERGRTLESILFQYEKTVKPSYTLFCEPTQQRADIVIPRGKENVVAIHLLSDHIKNKLIEGGNVASSFFQRDSESPLKKNKAGFNFPEREIPENVMLAAHKLVGDVQSNTDSHLEDDDKVNYAAEELCNNEQLSGKELLSVVTLLCNQLLTLCNQHFVPKKFVTPTPSPTSSPSPRRPSSVPEEKSNGAKVVPNTLQKMPSSSPEIMYMDDSEDDEDVQEGSPSFPDNENGDTVKMNLAQKLEQDGQDGNTKKTEAKKVCVVTILSGGILFGESILESIGKNQRLQVQYGSIHIFHESHKPSKPRFYDRKLPPNISDQKVILVDAFIGTGNRARMALQVIIDHHVPEENICFISLVSTKSGIVNLARVFPNVQFITGRINEKTGRETHWETTPVTSELVIRYCKAAGIDIVEDDCSSSALLVQ